MSDAIETRIDPHEWADHVRMPARPQIVVGGPGTGKTQFLAQRIASAVEDGGMDPGAILVLGFSRKGVTDLSGRLSDLLGSTSNRINIATYHGLAMRIVEEHAGDLGWDQTPSVLTAAEQERFAADVLASEPKSAWPPGYRTLLDSTVMAGEVTDFILRCHEQLLIPADLEEMDDPRFVAMAGFMTRYNARLRTDHRTDYGRIVTDAVETLRRSPGIAARYELVVADEYQDSSPAQAEMIFLLSGSTKNLIVAADPYQSIFSFRGTDINNVFDFPRVAEERLGTPAERIVLTTSHRVPAEILESAVSVTGRELRGGAGKVQSTRSGGSVASHVFDSESAEAEWVASDIERVHLVDGVPLERVAVFMRSRSSFGSELAAALERRAIPHSFATSRLADEPVVRFIRDLVQACATDDQVAELAIRRVLMSPFVGMPYGAVNELSRRVARGTAWSDVITRSPSAGKALASLLTNTDWATSLPAPDGLWHVWATLPQLVPVALDESHASDRRAWSAYNQVVTRLDERSPGTTLIEHIRVASDAEFEDDPLFAYETQDEGGVSIASLHAAKGTEFDVVYIPNAVEGSLPDLRGRDSLLGTRLLNPHLPSDTRDYVSFRLDEERRLAYTAMTRATSRVVWTATMNDEGGGGTQPSRFLRLVAPITEPRSHPEPLTPRSFEAALRRTAKDPLIPLVDRLAAINTLAEGTHVGLSAPMTRYGVAERGTDSGIIPDKLRLSPSQANAYVACPRQYAIDRYLLVRPEENEFLRFGTLIHHVLEVAETKAVAQGKERSTRIEAQDELDASWETLGFGHNAIAASWRVRAETTLDNLYEKWPRSGAPAAFEQDLTMTIAGVDWMGRADRIERRGDELFVVDYKTSGKATNVADAKVSIQLGFYLKAAREDAELRELGACTGAEFWFPRAKPNKNSIVTRSFEPSALDDVVEQLAEITDAIGAEEFDPVPGKQCARCQLALVCPARDAGREAFAQ